MTQRRFAATCNVSEHEHMSLEVSGLDLCFLVPKELGWGCVKSKPRVSVFFSSKNESNPVPLRRKLRPFLWVCSIKVMLEEQPRVAFGGSESCQGGSRRYKYAPCLGRAGGLVLGAAPVDLGGAMGGFKAKAKATLCSAGQSLLPSKPTWGCREGMPERNLWAYSTHTPLRAGYMEGPFGHDSFFNLQTQPKRQSREVSLILTPGNQSETELSRGQVGEDDALERRQDLADRRRYFEDTVWFFHSVFVPVFLAMRGLKDVWGWSVSSCFAGAWLFRSKGEGRLRIGSMPGPEPGRSKIMWGFSS